MSKKAEYLAEPSAVQQMPWLRHVVQECGFGHPGPTKLLNYNIAAIQVAKNTSPTIVRKLIDVAHHHLGDRIQKQTIVVNHVPSQHNAPDPLTKSLGRLKRPRYMAHMQLTPIPKLIISTTPAHLQTLPSTE